ncbi:transposase [Streptomyces sp. NPDC001268]|uniref:transposase n=1 Tax=Streptomyces sp. NPDC001268 TaxID=3364553 RepID=UPI0036C9BE75
MSNLLRPDAPTGPDRLFCPVHGRNGRFSDHCVPGRPYSFVAALETCSTSWCRLLDAVRVGPDDDAAEVTAAQVRGVVTAPTHGGQWETGDRGILVVFDAGSTPRAWPASLMASRWKYGADGLGPGDAQTGPRDVTRPRQGGRPPEHGKDFVRGLARGGWPEPGGGQSQPASLAIRIASTRLRAPSLVTMVDR